MSDERTLTDTEQHFWDVVVFLQQKGLLPARGVSSVRIGRVQDYAGDWSLRSDYLDEGGEKHLTIEKTVSMSATWGAYRIEVELWLVRSEWFSRYGPAISRDWQVGSISIWNKYSSRPAPFQMAGSEEFPWRAKNFLHMLAVDPNQHNERVRGWMNLR